MILKETEILELIKNPANKNIKQWQKDHNKLDIYVSGGDVASELEKIKNYENEEQKKLREKVARSTKDKVKDLLNPLHKIFNASGGSIRFDDLTDVQEQKINDHIDLIPEGISIRKWMEIYWKKAFICDPNGIILIEINQDSIAYPTYKNINVIHDYVMSWDNFEYIILKSKEKNTNTSDDDVDLYRVIDEEKDALYYEKGGELYEYGDNAVLNHNYGFIPAVVCGGIVDIESGGKLPFIHDIDEALEEYLRASSVHTIYKFLHLFPKFWSYAMKCVTCDGTGKVENERYVEGSNEPRRKVCPTCNGKGLKVSTDVSDGIYLPIPKGDQPVLGGNIAGYIDTPINAWEQQKEDLKDMLDEMSFTLWGSYLADRDEGKERTATESYINVQPINDTLHSISRIAETKESKICTYIAKIETQSEKVSVVVKYGKRFIIETPDTLWNKYLEAKDRQAPITTLDYHYEQYLMAEYQNDLVMYEFRKKMFSIEPFAHYSLKDIKETGTEAQVQKKIIFSQWVNSDIDFNKDAKKLTAEFEEYYKKNKPEVAQEQKTNQNTQQ